MAKVRVGKRGIRGMTEFEEFQEGSGGDTEPEAKPSHQNLCA